MRAIMLVSVLIVGLFVLTLPGCVQSYSYRDVEVRLVDRGTGLPADGVRVETGAVDHFLGVPSPGRDRGVTDAEGAAILEFVVPEDLEKVRPFVVAMNSDDRWDGHILYCSTYDDVSVLLEGDGVWTNEKMFEESELNRALMPWFVTVRVLSSEN